MSIGRAFIDPRRLAHSCVGIPATAEVFAACGVNPALFADSTGTAGREAYQQFLHSTLAYIPILIYLRYWVLSNLAALSDISLGGPHFFCA